jgi:hypothetical protein
MVDVTSPEYLAESKVQSIIICNAILIACSGIGMGVRLFVRSRYLSGIGWDDIFCLIGYVRLAVPKTCLEQHWLICSVACL